MHVSFIYIQIMQAQTYWLYEDSCDPSCDELIQ